MNSRVGWLFFGLACIHALSTALAAEVRVFAAASLSDVLEPIARACDADDTIVFNFSGSNTLVRQIVEGAPADVVITADEATLDELDRKGLLAGNSRASLLTNSLVVVVPRGDRDFRSVEDLANVDRIALANPAAVPAGKYARRMLEESSLWVSVKDRIIPTENVRAALAAVAAGNADAAIVYRTDSTQSEAVDVACVVPAAKAPEILYPVAILKDASDRAAAERFVACLKSSEAKGIFEKYGFHVLDSHDTN